jgi:serine/threonine-protein kinase
MATVYLARDVKHGRQVAIKVLAGELAATLGKGRFNREIEIAAKLSHPHILPLHDSGVSKDFIYYVMPYIQGESLRDRLDREQQLPLEDALLIAREVADGLSYAHAYGVIHRDIKPENIMLTGGHAIIADFGVARALTAAGDDQLTGTGLAIGTPAYMSPEQASGRTELDGRSDQYALGCLLYEMLAGQPPFSAPSASGIMTQHMTVPPPPITALRPSVPPELAKLLHKLLAKSPADRFPTAKQVVETLTTIETRVGTGWVTPVTSDMIPAMSSRRRSAVKVGLTAAVLVGAMLGGTLLMNGGRTVSADPPRRIVVLPFVNQGSEDDEYFADGLTDEVTDRLAGLPGLAVIARTSAWRYKKTTLPIRQVAEELDVDYVLAGTVHWDKSGGGEGRVRVTSELISDQESRIWADRFDAALANVFEIQSNIASGVADELDVALGESERRTLATRPTNNLGAYDFYLRGNEYYNRGWREADVRTAIDQFERAVEQDPDLALALARLSKAHSLMYQLRIDRSQTRLHRAKQAADRALALDPSLAASYEALGHYYYWGFREYEPAIDAFENALRRQSNYATVHNAMGNVRRRQGRWQEAIASYERAITLDPGSHVIAHNLAEAHYLIREYDRVDAYLDRSVNLAPDFLDSYIRRAMLHISSEGDVAGAASILEDAAGRIPPATWRPLWLWWDLGLFRIVDADEGMHRLQIGSFGVDSATFYLSKGALHRRRGEQESAMVYFDSARVVLEQLAAAEPQWARYQGSLGLAYAGLGRAGEAVRQGRLAMQLLPTASDALDGPDWVYNMARIQLWVGNTAAAADYLQQYLAMPSRISPRWIGMDPEWEPLRQMMASGPAPTKHTSIPPAQRNEAQPSLRVGLR